MGTTGSGKSRLAIDLATSLPTPCEVVNADVIQMYCGLDVASAKVPLAQRSEVAHHLMSFLQPTDVVTVRDYKALATAVIHDIHSRGRVPIVTGGTLYYMQALLVDTGTLQEEEEEEAQAGRQGPADAAVTAGTYPSLWHRLQAVDPTMSNRLHPHDHRKIQRALEVYERTGLTYSALLQQQAERIEAQRDEGKDGDGWDRLLLWTRVGPSPGPALDVRLDERVLAMVQAGLMAEISRLHRHIGTAAAVLQLHENDDRPSDLTIRVVEEYRATSGRTFTSSSALPGSATPPAAASSSSAGVPTLSTPYTGLLQAIGFKEFSDWLQLDVPGPPPQSLQAEALTLARQARDGHSSIRPGKGQQEQLIALAVGLRSLLDGTHQYARKQDRWIRNRFARKGMRLLAIDTRESEVQGDGEDRQADMSPSKAEAGKKRTRKPSPSRANPAPLGSVVELRPAVQPGSPQEDGPGSSGRPVDWWQAKVVQPAAAAVTTWLACGLTGIPSWDGESIPAGEAGHSAGVAVSAGTAQNELSAIQSWVQHVCHPCGGRVLNGERAWNEHVGSKAHLKAVARANRPSAPGMQGSKRGPDGGGDKSCGGTSNS